MVSIFSHAEYLADWSQWFIFRLCARLKCRFYCPERLRLGVSSKVECDMKETFRARKGLRTLECSNKRYGNEKQDIAPDDEVRDPIQFIPMRDENMQELLENRHLDEQLVDRIDRRPSIGYLSIQSVSSHGKLRVCVLDQIR